MHNISLYRKSILTNREEIMWELKNDNLDFIAGVVAGAIPMIKEVNDNNQVEEYSDDRYYRYRIDTKADIYDYRILKEIDESEIPKMTTKYIIYERAVDDNEYAVWMKSAEKYKYNLYKFAESSFMQGLLTIAEKMDVDFRKYLFGQIVNNKLETLVMAGYAIDLYQIAIDAPDMEDIDLEEMDDENIVEPLRKDY